MLSYLSSTKLTSILLVVLLISVISLIKFPDASHWLAIPLIGLLINLIAAVLSKSKLWQNIYLLAFHLGLVVFLIVVVLNNLSTKQGHVEVTEGGDFPGHLDEVKSGPIDLSPLDELRFTLQAIEIQYNSAAERIGTFAKILVQQPTMQPKVHIITDQHPFVFNGNRFYISANKGFAIVVRWHSNKENSAVTGSIHLPSYPANRLKQNIQWQPPGSPHTYHFFLDFDNDFLTTGKAVNFSPPTNPRLIIRGYNNKRVILEQGHSANLHDGKVTFVAVHSWMGFKVKYDALSAWVLAAGLMCIICLVGFLINKKKPTDTNKFHISE